MASNTIIGCAHNTALARSPARHLRLTPIAAAVALALGGVPGAGLANPQGGVVQAGQASIHQTAPNRIDIVQTTPRAAINWQSFSIGAAERVNFQQPSASSATLNRVVGADPSVILGRLTANGQVFLVNPNGMLFAPGSKIDVGALIASTANISNANFMAGQLKFDEVSNRSATIVNRGEITAARGGLVALVAPGVENAGVIRALLGRVALASGNAFTLDLYGDKLVRLVVDDAAMDRLTDVEGRTLRSLVGNSGRIEADGGSVLLAAASAKGVLDAAINMSGVIEARGFELRAGAIELHGGANGTTQVSGVLDASGSAAGQRGGDVSVLGDKVELASSARVDVSGPAGGGSALIGGDWQGGGATLRATTTVVDAGARLAADATTTGDGGKVVVWADDSTRYAGTISARGGALAGNGGNVEVSGKHTLAYQGSVDASAPHGRAGTLLLDPTDWIINAADADTLSLDLRGGTNVALQADNEIQVNESIDGRGGVAGASLSLDAGNRITLNNDLLTNNGAIALKAGTGGVQMGAGSRATANNGAVISAGNQTIGIETTGTVDAQHLTTTGAVNVTTTGATSNVALRRDLNGIAGAPLGSLAVNSGGSIEAGGLNATGAALLNAGGAITLTPSATTSFAAGSVNATAGGALTAQRDVVGKGGGAVTLTSVGKLTVDDVLTSGAVGLESTGDTVDLTRDLVGAAGSNGVGQVTIRSAAPLTIDNALRSTAGVDIRAGGADAASSRALTVALPGTARIEANVGNAGAKQSVALGGASVALNSGEVHSNGGAITIDARNGTTSMGAGAGLFAGSGDVTSNSTGRVDLTRVSTSGDLAVTSTNGAIRLDGDLGADLVAGGATTPQPIGSVTLSASGSYSQDRIYYTNYNFTAPPPTAPGGQTPPQLTASSNVGVRVRGIKSSGPVTITASQSGAEILTDGIIDAQNNVTLNASTVRLRHSIFATGGNITIGGQLVVDPWGDEIGFLCRPGYACNPAAPAGLQNSLLLTSDTYAQGGVSDSSAPGSTLTERPHREPDSIASANWDIVTSQVTLRAEAAGGSGGGIALTAGAGRNPDSLNIRSDQQFVRFDRGNALPPGPVPPPAPNVPVSRSALTLVPLNDVTLNLQSSSGVTFTAGSTGSFAWFGTDPGLANGNAGPLPAFGGINQPYFRLAIAGLNGVADLSTQSVVGGTFSGTLYGLNGTPPGGSGGAATEPAVALPGATFILSHLNPSGLEAPPGPTNVTPGLFTAGEITPGSASASGSGSTDGGAGITVADARSITPPAVPPPPAPPPSPAPAPGPAPSPAPAPSPPSSPAPGSGTPDPTQTVVATDPEVLIATQPTGAGSGADAGTDLFKVADLGRGLAVRGSAVDVFRARSNLTSFAASETRDADTEYFGLSLFEYLTRKLTRGRR